MLERPFSPPSSSNFTYFRQQWIDIIGNLISFYVNPTLIIDDPDFYLFFVLLKALPNNLFLVSLSHPFRQFYLNFCSTEKPINECELIHDIRSELSFSVGTKNRKVLFGKQFCFPFLKDNYKYVTFLCYFNIY